MNGRLWRRLAAMLLVLPLLLTQAYAAPAGLPAVDLKEHPLSITVTADTGEWSPLDKERAGWLHDLVSFHAIRLNLMEGFSSMVVSVDGSDAFDISLAENKEGTVASTSLLPGRAFSAKVGGMTALDLLVGRSASGSDDLLPDLNDLQMLNDAEQMVTELQRTAKDKLVVKKKKSTVAGFGSCVRSLTLTVDEEEANEFGSMLIAACPYGPLMDILTEINYSGDQELVLLTESDGTVHKVTYEGICGEDGNMRRFKIVWLLSRSDKLVKDDLSITMPPASSSGSDVLTFTRNEQLESKGGFTGKYIFNRSANLRSGKNSVALEAELSVKPSSDDITAATGVINLDTSGSGEGDQHLAFKLDGSLNTADWTGSGSLEAKQVAGGHTLKEATLSIQVAPCQAAASMEPVVPVTALDLMPEDELSTLRTELFNAAALQLVSRWMMLPEEGSMYISKDLPDDVWLKLCFAALDLTEEEE